MPWRQPVGPDWPAVRTAANCCSGRQGTRSKDGSSSTWNTSLLYFCAPREPGEEILGHIGAELKDAARRNLRRLCVRAPRRQLTTVDEGLTVPIDGLYATIQDVGIAQHDPAFPLAQLLGQWKHLGIGGRPLGIVWVVAGRRLVTIASQAPGNRAGQANPPRGLATGDGLSARNTTPAAATRYVNGIMGTTKRLRFGGHKSTVSV